MATFSLVRDTRVFISTEAAIANMSDTNTWQIPVLDGYSFTADTNVETVTVSEAGISNVARGQQAFTTAINPVEWALTTYMRPRWGGAPDNEADAVERVLWEGLAAANANNTIGTILDGLATTMGGAGAGMTVDFLDSDTNELLELSIIFNLGDNWYHITQCLVNQAEVDFSIDTIAQIGWSGFGTSLVSVEGSDLTTLQGWAGTARFPNSGVIDTNDYVTAPTAYTCIRNKLSTVELTDNDSPGTSYTVALTGGSLTINNNIEFLTPENLGVVNQPCGGFTGTREISGNMTAYLKTGAGLTGGLLTDLLTDLNDVTQDFALIIHAGNGINPASPDFHVPQVAFNMPHTHINIPTVNVEDVLSVDIGFTALPTDSAGAFDLEYNNELTVTYYPDES